MTSRATVAFLATALITLTACAGGAGNASPTPSTSGSVSTVVQPTRRVEFVISTAVGGGSDLYAREWARIIDKLKLSPQPVDPLNKEGGSGIVAFTYVYGYKGDMHYLMVTLNSFFTTIITAKPPPPFKTTDFTPIANLALDPFFLWVNEDSPWKTAQDFITAAQEKSIVVAGTGAKQEDEALFRRIQDLAKTKPFTYVSQSGGATVADALQKHAGIGAASAGVEATVNNPSEGAPFYEQTATTKRTLRPLCAFTPESPKTGLFASPIIPTCKSQGLAIDDYYIMRAVMGPPDLTPQQQAFWVGVFTKVFESDDWKAYVQKFSLEPAFKSGIEFRQFILQYQQLHQEIAAKNGWV